MTAVVGIAKGGISGVGSFSVTPPAGATGYLAILAVGTASGTIASVTPPSGWTLQASGQNDNFSDYFIYTAGSSPGSSWTIGSTSSPWAASLIVVGYDTSVTIHAFATGTADSFVSPSVTTTQPCLVVRAETGNPYPDLPVVGYPTAAPSNRDSRADPTADNPDDHTLSAVAHASSPQGAAGATGTATWTTTGLDSHSSHTIAILNVSGGGPQVLAGTVTAVSTTVGDLKAIRQMAGSVAAVSASAGSLSLIPQLSGAVNAVSAVSGTLLAIPQLAGTVTAVSTCSGAMLLIPSLAGVVTALAATFGDLTGPTTGMSGVVTVLSGTSGTLLAVPLLSGSVAVISATSGDLKALLDLAGMATVVSRTFGAITLGSDPGVEVALMSNADLELEYLRTIKGATGRYLVDARMQIYGANEFAYFSALSGLTPVFNFSLADHQIAYYRTQTGAPSLTLPDTARMFWASAL